MMQWIIGLSEELSRPQTLGFAPSQEFDQEHAACSWGTAICAHVQRGGKSSYVLSDNFRLGPET